MPITAQDDQQALDWLVNNPNDSRVSEVQAKLGVGPDEVQAWKWSKSNLIDPRVVDVRNKVFDTIANSRPSVDEMPSGAVLDRAVIKNLLDNEPDLQAEYLKKKGYDVRWVYKEEKLKPARLGSAKNIGEGVEPQPRTIKGEVLEVKRPEDNKWGVIDPKSLIDFWDITDVIGDSIEAAAGAMAAGSKPFGPGGIVAGGLTTAGVETARQLGGLAIGAREGLNVPKIIEAGVTGATVPAAFGIGGKTIKGIGTLYEKGLGLLGIAKKPAAKEITESAKLLGAKATPGQIYESKLVGGLESTAYQSPGQVGGFFTRRQIKANQKAVEDTAKSLVKGSTQRTRFEIGDEVGDKLIKETETRLAPVEDIYDKYEALFEKTPNTIPFVKGKYKPDVSSVLSKAKSLKGELKYDDYSMSLLNKIVEDVKSIKTLVDLKDVRTKIFKATKPTEPQSYYVAGELSSLLTDVRSSTLKDLAKISSGGDNNVFKKMFDEINYADFEYKGIINDVQNAIGKVGKKLPAGPLKSVKKFVEETPEIERINKILKTNDPRKIAQVKNSFPEAFEALKTGKLSEIAKRSEESGKIDPKKLSNILNDLPPETMNLLFNKDAVLKIKALKIYLDNIPPMAGPSGTPAGVDLRKLINPVTQFYSIGRSALQHIITSPDAVKKIGDLINTRTAKGLGLFGAEQFTNQSNEQSSLIPTKKAGLTVPKGVK